MKKAFIIMAYKDPKQIERLVRRMYHPSFDFYIHVDKKIDIGPFEYLKDEPNVFFPKDRNTIAWASYTFTKTVLEIAREIISSDTHYDFIASMSGQDYPIKPIDEIVAYYESKMDKSFITIVDEKDPWWDHAVTRVEKYHMTDFSFKGRYLMQFTLNAFLPKRKFPLFQKLYGGPRATWWTLNREMIKYVIEFVDRHPKLDRFARYTWCADEFFIHTILMNSNFRDSVILDSGRYIDWSQGGSNPKILTLEDYPHLKNSPLLYARKFDIKVDTVIQDKIDQLIDS